MEGNQTSLIESSDSDIKKLMASAVPESTSYLLNNPQKLVVYCLNSGEVRYHSNNNPNNLTEGLWVIRKELLSIASFLTS